MVAVPEPGARRRNETVWQFLERSSEPVAAAARAQWDGWLSGMPSGPRDALVRRLQDRHDEQVRAALAELVTFVMLDSVYPAVEIEPETATGSRTDFAVQVPVRTHFEVHRSTPAKESAMDARRLGDIAAELEKIESPDFWLDVDPQSGEQVPSMRTVRQQVEAWLASLDYETEAQRRDEHQQGRRERAAEPMPGLDAGPAERAAYLAAHRPFEPPTFERSGNGWSVRITAHPRPADAARPRPVHRWPSLRRGGPPGDLRGPAGGSTRQAQATRGPSRPTHRGARPQLADHRGSRHRRDALRADDHDDAGPVHRGDHDPRPAGGHLARSGSATAPPSGRADSARDMTRVGRGNSRTLASAGYRITNAARAVDYEDSLTRWATTSVELTRL